ncbi:MAG: phage tail assembly chaperone [Sphingomicrobium sp.]
MARFFSPSRKGFFDEAIHGLRELTVVDQDALDLLQAKCLEEGEESDACMLLSLDPPTRSVDNPDTLIPDDAIELSEADYAELLGQLSEGQELKLVDGRPAAVERDVPVEEQLAAVRRRRNRALASTDWTQQPDALTAARRKLWADHRKALRDLPAMLEKAVKAGRPVESVKFPDPPKD